MQKVRIRSECYPAKFPLFSEWIAKIGNINAGYPQLDTPMPVFDTAVIFGWL